MTFQCNSRDTLNYIANYNRSDEAFWLNEKSIKADGPLFDLPGGTVKAAIGASYISNKYYIEQQSQRSQQHHHQSRSGIRKAGECLGHVRAAERPRLQRAERDLWLPEVGLRSLLAPRPVQRFRRHQQSEDRLQLVADRGCDLQGRLWHLVPRAELRRELVARQRRMERLWNSIGLRYIGRRHSLASAATRAGSRRRVPVPPNSAPPAFPAPRPGPRDPEVFRSMAAPRDRMLRAGAITSIRMGRCSSPSSRSTGR